jgi:ribosomal-protein-alanine N-acetyltransferase
MRGFSCCFVDRDPNHVTARMRSIEAGDLALEPQTAAHAEQMFAVLSDPAIYQYENEPPRSLEWLRDRFARLESRCSPDGREQWLNWVIRLPTSELVGYVQATVHADGRAAIAYELASVYWGRGIARQAIEAMIAELSDCYRVRNIFAVLKRENRRSLRLLERLGFTLASAELHAERAVEAGELLMRREIVV